MTTRISNSTLLPPVTPAIIILALDDKPPSLPPTNYQMIVMEMIIQVHKQNLTKLNVCTSSVNPICNETVLSPNSSVIILVILESQSENHLGGARFV